jgi:hypothetical protein
LEGWKNGKSRKWQHRKGFFERVKEWKNGRRGWQGVEGDKERV